MALAALLLLAAAQAPEPPRTVNGIIIGKAEDYMTAGPGRVCVGHTSIDLEAGETAYLHYRGIHFASIRVIGPHGSYLVKEGGAWSKPGGRSEELSDWRGRSIVRNRRSGAVRYVIHGNDESGDEHPGVWLEGDAFGRSRDMSIIDRVNSGRKEPAGCRRHYDYGWSFFLGKAE